MTEFANELRQKIFKETESLTFDIVSDRSAAEIPTSNDVAYQTGYQDALIDAKIYFRMLVMRLLGEKQ